MPSLIRQSGSVFNLGGRRDRKQLRNPWNEDPDGDSEDEYSHHGLNSSRPGQKTTVDQMRCPSYHGLADSESDVDSEDCAAAHREESIPAEMLIRATEKEKEIWNLETNSPPKASRRSRTLRVLRRSNLGMENLGRVPARNSSTFAGKN